MNKFDLQKTQAVVDLLKVEASQRDRQWQHHLLTALPTASLESEEPQVILGPDNQAYFVLKTPQSGATFSPFSIAHIIDVCLSNGFGAVLNPHQGAPDCLIRYGALWHYKEAGTLIEPALVSGTEEDSLDGENILVASPSEVLFPKYARTVLHKVLQAVQVKEPAVMLISGSKAQPTRLVFNLFPEDCTSEQEFSQRMQFLSWYIPNSHGLTAISKDSPLASKFQPFK